MAAPAALVTDLTTEVPSARPLMGADLAGRLDDLAAYYAHLAPCFAGRDQRAWVALDLRGLLTADVRRTNSAALALRRLGAGRAAARHGRALQDCLSKGAWDAEGRLAGQRRLVAERLGEAEGVLLRDGSAISKQGRPSVGVARHWWGRVASRTTASRRGDPVLDRRPGLPAAGDGSRAQ